jgi:hypothetical protein
VRRVDSQIKVQVLTCHSPSYLGVFTADGDCQTHILEWIYAASKALQYDSVKLWSEDVMQDVKESRPGQHTLAAAGLLFCQGRDQRNFKSHANYTQEEFQVFVRV